MFARTGVPAHHAHEADVLYLGPLAASVVAGPVAGTTLDNRATAVESVIGCQGRTVAPWAPVSPVVQGASTRVVVVGRVLVQVQRVVVRVPGRHQVTGWDSGRGVGYRGWGREAGGGGTALIWKDV